MDGQQTSTRDCQTEGDMPYDVFKVDQKPEGAQKEVLFNGREKQGLMGKAQRATTFTGGKKKIRMQKGED